MSGDSRLYVTPEDTITLVDVSNRSHTVPAAAAGWLTGIETAVIGRRHRHCRVETDAVGILVTGPDARVVCWPTRQPLCLVGEICDAGRRLGTDGYAFIGFTDRAAWTLDCPDTPDLTA